MIKYKLNKTNEQLKHEKYSKIMYHCYIYIVLLILIYYITK